MSELLSHPLDPLGARVLVPVGRAGVPAPFALRSQHNRPGARVGRWARNPSGPARGTIPRERRLHPQRGVSLRVFRRRVPDSVGCAPTRMPSLQDRCPIVHRGSREPFSPHDAACLVSASFHRFAPLLPLIGSFRAYRRQAIAAISGLALSSIPPNPRSGHLLDGAGSPQLRPAHSFKPARN